MFKTVQTSSKLLHINAYTSKDMHRYIHNVYSSYPATDLPHLHSVWKTWHQGHLLSVNSADPSGINSRRIETALCFQK